MRILDEYSDKSIKKLLLFLTISEAMELRDGLDDIINKPLNNHSHILSEDFHKELIVCIYDMNNIKEFNDRSTRLIVNDV